MTWAEYHERFERIAKLYKGAYSKGVYSDPEPSRWRLVRHHRWHRQSVVHMMALDYITMQGWDPLAEQRRFEDAS